MATKDCTFFVDIDGRQVEMDFDGFRAYLMQDGVMATLAPDLTKKRGQKVGFTVTAQRAEPTPARAEAAPVRAEAPTPSEMEVSSENLRKLMPKLSKARADAIIAVMKAMGIPFDRLKLAKGKLEGKETLQQADTKARDAEYMAAVKASDTAKAQKMVDEAAKAAGYYSTRRFYHGTPDGRFSVFEKNRGVHERGLGVFAFSDSRNVADQFRGGLWVKRDALTGRDDWVIGEESGLAVKAYPKHSQVKEVYLDLSNPDVYDMGGGEYRESFVSGAIKEAKKQKRTSVVFRNMRDGSYTAAGRLPVSNVVFTLSPNQIKSADPITYDDKGNVIPLSERFKPESPDIRYQEEASPLGSITFIDDLNALISVFEKANFSTVIHEAMHFYRRHMLNTAQGFTAEEIKRFERWAEVKNGKWTVEAEEKAARAFEKYLRDGLAPLPELRDLFRKVAKWMREVYATLTKSPIDIDIPADIRQIFDRIFTLEAERQGKTPPTTLQQADFTPAPAVVKAAKKWAGVSEVTPSLSEAQRTAYTAVYKANQSRLLDIVKEYNSLMRGMRETMKAQPLDKLAKAVPEGAIFVQGARNQSGSTDDGVKTQFIDYLMDSLDDVLADWIHEHLATHTGVPVAQWRQRRDLRNRFTVTEQVTEAEQEKAGSPQALLENKNRFATGKPLLVQVYHGTSSTGIAGHRFSSEFGGAATGAASATRGFFFAGSQLTSLGYAMDTVPERGRLAAPRVLEFFVKMRNPFVYDMKGMEYRERSYDDILEQATEKGHDGVVITNTYDGGPLDNIFVVLHGNENQIKSADPTTYDDTGKPIPMKERFKETPDIRYQREEEGVPQAETATAAYRRAMKERQQERATEALRRLGQKKETSTTFAPTQPRPSLEITPVNRRAVVEAMQELRDFKRKLTEQKGGLAAASDADLDKWEKLLNRAEQLGGGNPITPQMDAQYQAVIKAGVVGKRGQTVQAALDKAVSTAFGVPEVTRVPDTRKWRAIDWEEEIDWQDDRVARRLVLDELEITEDDVDWNDIREEDVYILGFQDPDVWGEWDWEDIPDFEDVREPTLLAYPRVKIAGRENAIGELVHEYMILQGEERMGEGAPPAPLPDAVETGKPIVAQVFRGGTFEGTEFQSNFLGKMTNAQSARMGYFFAATPQTANIYTQQAERKASPKLADSMAASATRSYYVYMRNPLVHDNEGNTRRTIRLPELINEAIKQRRDGVIVKNVHDPIEEHLFIILPGYENQIKSAEPETSDSKGNLIPLSERFNPLTKNVLYQGEDPLPNVEGTSTEAFRRKQAEQRQKNLVDAMNRLRQGKAQMPPKTEAKAAEAATPPPTAQAAPQSATPPKATSEGRQRKENVKANVRNATQARRRGFGGKSLDEIFNAYVQRAKAGNLAPTATATESEKLEERILRGLRDVIRAAYELNLQDTAVADQAKTAAGEALAAQRVSDTAAQEKALQDFANIVAQSRELLKKAKPQKTVAQQYDDMLKRAQKPGKPYQAATPEERADMYIKRQIRKLQDLLKMAQKKGINTDTMEVNGKTVSRKDHFTQAAEDYRKAFLNQDHVGMSAAADRMRDATDSIISQLPKLKAMPLWYNLRSPLSYANVVGTYEGQMGELGRQISEAFMRVHSDIARDKVSFSEGLQRLQEQMNRVYKPLMVDEGYYGMPRVIDDHITYLRNSMAYNRALQKMLKEQADKNIKFLKNPMDWYVLRRDFARQRIGDQYGAFPLASAMLKSFIYTTKLKYNVKSAITQYASLIMSVGPYLSPDQLAKIIVEAGKPSTANRKVDGDLTLRQVAVGESGGRQAEGAPAETTPSSWWHRGDAFQFTSEQVRIAGYLVGEEMVRREQEYRRKRGHAPIGSEEQRRRIRDWVEKVEFDNSPWNMAPMFRGPVKGVLFQFKPFLQKNVERFIADMIRNPIGYQRGEARTPVGRLVDKLPDKVVRRAAAFGYQIGFGGISSALTLIPGLKNVAAPLILGGLTSALVAMGMDDDDAEEFAIAINYGFPAAIGIDLSSSLGFLDDIPGKTLAEQIVNFGLGPTVSTLAEIGKRTGELVETVQKPAKLGREEEKQAEVMRRAMNIPKAVTPYARMFETAMDWVRGKPSTIYLDKEMELTPYEKVIRMLGGSPIRQTMFFDEKESYGWQKSLLGKPTGLDRLKKKEGESDAEYFQRKARADALEARYLPPLQNNPGFRALSKEDQDIVLDNLWRNIVEESDTPKPPNRSKFNPAVLVRTRRANIRAKAREARRQARERLYYGGGATQPEE